MRAHFRRHDVNGYVRPGAHVDEEFKLSPHDLRGTDAAPQYRLVDYRDKSQKVEVRARSYLLGLEPDTISGSTDAATGAGAAPVASNAANVMAASRYAAASQGPLNIVSGSMIC